MHVINIVYVMPDPYVGVSPDFSIAQGLPVMDEVMDHSSCFVPNFYAKLISLTVMRVVC